jgi:hypothetical protein
VTYATEGQLQQGNLYDPYGLVNTYSASGTNAGTQTTDESWMQNPDIANVVLSLMGLGLSDAQAQATLKWYYDEMNANMEFDKWSTQATLAAATRQAQIAASSGNQQAQISANARLEEARINAETAMATAQLDSQTRLRIAAAEIEEQFQARVARETTAPTDWPYQLALLKNRNPVTAPRSGVSGALGVPAAQQIYSRAGAAPSPVAASPAAAMMGQGDAAWQAFQQGNAAVVGDGGPEIIEPTPRGTNVIPITSQSLANRARYLPKMQAGGFIPRSGQVMGDPRDRLGGVGLAARLAARAAAQPQAAAATPGSIQGLNQPRTTGIRGTGSFDPNLGSGGGYSTGVGNWGGTGSRMQPNQPRQFVTGQGWQAQRPSPYGVQPGAGGNPRSIEPPVTPTSTVTPGMEGFSDILWDPWAAFQATSAPRMTSQGVAINRWPWEENLNDFLRLPTQVQGARLAAWRDAGIIAGDTEETMWNSALQMMKQSAPLGTATALPRYG